MFKYQVEPVKIAMEKVVNSSFSVKAWKVRFPVFCHTFLYISVDIGAVVLAWFTFLHQFSSTTVTVNSLIPCFLAHREIEATIRNGYSQEIFFY